jgi:hypothetical protein
MLGYTAASLEIADLPILPASMRATTIFSKMRRLVFSPKPTTRPHRDQHQTRGSSIRNWEFTLGVPFATTLAETFPSLQTRFPNMTETKTYTPFKWEVHRNSATYILIQLAKANKTILLTEIGLAATSALTFYTPAFFFRKFITWLENDPSRGPVHASSLGESESRGWAWVYVAGIFGTTVVMYREFHFFILLLLESLMDWFSSYRAVMVHLYYCRATQVQDPAQHNVIRQNSRPQKHCQYSQ